MLTEQFIQRTYGSDFEVLGVRRKLKFSAHVSRAMFRSSWKLATSSALPTGPVEVSGRLSPAERKGPVSRPSTSQIPSAGIFFRGACLIRPAPAPIRVRPRARVVHDAIRHADCLTRITTEGSIALFTAAIMIATQWDRTLRNSRTIAPRRAPAIDPMASWRVRKAPEGAARAILGRHRTSLSDSRSVDDRTRPAPIHGRANVR